MLFTEPGSLASNCTFAMNGVGPELWPVTLIGPDFGDHGFAGPVCFDGGVTERDALLGFSAADLPAARVAIMPVAKSRQAMVQRKTDNRVFMVWVSIELSFAERPDYYEQDFLTIVLNVRRRRNSIAQIVAMVRPLPDRHALISPANTHTALLQRTLASGILLAVQHNEDYVLKVLEDVGLVTRKQIETARSKLNGAEKVV